MKNEDRKNLPLQPWIVFEQGSPFRAEDATDDEEEDDEFGWELAIARRGSHGTKSWGRFGPEKLRVSTGRSDHEGSMTPELWKALKKVANEECARMNQQEGLVPSLSYTQEEPTTFEERVHCASSDKVPFIQVVRSAPSLSASCGSCAYIAPSARTTEHYRCRGANCPAHRLEQMRTGALEAFQEAFFREEEKA